ncbi:MAG: thioredoxin-dependent thiol peroxidase [Anaerolineae bacterium]
MLAVGDMAPEFELVSDANEVVKLADFRGKRIVLFFYPRADTPGCTTQACGFRDEFPRIEAGNGTVLGISPDSPEKLARWKQKRALPYTLLSDPDHVTAEAYGVWGERKLYGRAYMGIIRSHFVIGADGRIEDIQFKVSPKESVKRALRFLEK